MQTFPQEILYAICAAVYNSAQPPILHSLDPLLVQESCAPTAHPSTYPPSQWPEPIARRTLANLTLVNKTWYNAAKPWLWKHVEVRLPASWLAFVDEITGGEDQDDQQAVDLVDKTITAAASAALAATPDKDPSAALRLRESIIASLSGPPDCSIPPELLSPPASRDPSPARYRRAKSPGRWRLIRAVSNAVQNVVTREGTGVYVPTPQDTRPGRFVEHLDFNHFRTIGMRRSVGEGVNSRFVTGQRVELVLKEMPNLRAFGATEYMDGALTLPVITDLLFRGHQPPERPRASRGRERELPKDDDDAADTEQDWQRRRDSQPLEALDLCGCVSAVFVNALADFVTNHLLPNDDDDRMSSDDYFSHDPELPRQTFPSLRRLGMRGVTSLPSTILTPFVLSFPSLTHLDLSGTRCTPDLLAALAASSTVSLTALALGRCTRLTSDSIATLLIDGPCTFSLEHLSLYGDAMFPSPIVENDMKRIILEAPSFRSGKLTYLDLSSNPLTPALLDLFPEQPRLRSLGLSYISTLSLQAIATFLQHRASNIEILTLVSTPELAQTIPARQVSMALHSHIIRPLCIPPLNFSISYTGPPKPPATKLRVIELQMSTLNALGGGANGWRTVRSKGGRGWYVDTASGWTAESGMDSEPVLRRDLEPQHPLRVALEGLANANGNVGSGIGWHARKMEILFGQGMVGREDGLYGAVSFAYQG